MHLIPASLYKILERERIEERRGEGGGGKGYLVKQRKITNISKEEE